MASDFDLIVTADSEKLSAEFRLLDEHGTHLASQQTDFTSLVASKLEGLFDLRKYIRLYAEPGQQEAWVAEIGVCIAEQVLGEEIFLKLWASEAQRTLRVELPGAGEEENQLAAALARVPWEMARPSVDKPTLAERHLLVRVVHKRVASATQPLGLTDDDSLRVLFVFAEAPGSRPLAARRERQQLRRLFEKEIYPQRRVEADFLSHGVTRERLEAQIDDRGGYHVIHWSGHGHLNLLELAKAGGGKDRITGGELLDLCGGYIPRLVFLSACHSGDVLAVKDWNDFFAVAKGDGPPSERADRQETTRQTAAGDTKDIPLDEAPGYTGTAHALLARGVPAVVAMRFEVGDDYARDLGVEFYRGLFAHARPKSAAAALTRARQKLRSAQTKASGYDACDPATPVLYGAAAPHLELAAGRSPALDTDDPRLHRIAELTTSEHQHFVGRTWQLAELGSNFIGAQAGGEVKPVAVITGLGGMGKTALTAEALSLWASRFEWVLLYQAKPGALSFDAFLRDVHMKLKGELGRYHQHVTKQKPADAIHRAADEDFTGQERLERLTGNLIRALRDEPILLVLDNFETNLKENAEPASEGAGPAWACQDPAWDRCFARLAQDLVGTPSRVLITCRRPLATLNDDVSHHVLLGPLPAGEAALYLRTHDALSRLLFSRDGADKALAMRLLTASRFYPLLMNRLARLATGGPELRPRLLDALEMLEKRHETAKLPELFAADAKDAEELRYLNDALASSLDALIAGADPDARRVLWLIAVANEPVSLGLLEGAWRGESHEQEQLRQIKQMLDVLPTLPAELQEKLRAMPPELRAMVDALPAEAPARPELAPLLRQLVAVGLVTEERENAEDKNPDLTCHELVRERIGAWMKDHPRDRAEWSENAIRLAYAERLKATFETLLHQNMTAALEAGHRALVYCVQTEAWDRLGGFAGEVVTSTRDPRLLEGLLPHLEAAADAAAEDNTRWSCLCYLADALRLSGRPDASLPFYEQAAAQARAVVKAGDAGRQRAASDLAWITANWAVALWFVGNLDDAQKRQLESAEAYRTAGSSAIEVIGRELEALRIDVVQGQAAEALPEVEKRVATVEGWWRQHRVGQPVVEAQEIEFLARAFIGALDVAKDAHLAQEDWPSALRRLNGILEVMRALQYPAEEVGIHRMNRANVLLQLGRFGDARAELESCLEIYGNDPARRARALSYLANLLESQGDGGQAITQERRALAVRETLPDPSERAISHSNLANYLERCGTTHNLAESPRHQLAALVYFLVAGIGQHLQTTLRNYAIRFRRVERDGVELAVPRVAELLPDPAFRPLEEWLRQRQVDVEEVQAAVDQFLEQAREAASQSE